MNEPRPEIGLPGFFSGLRVVASSTLVSRVLGMVREIASARLFGVSPIWDAFSYAFMIPNLARRLFGEGALSATFLPVFASQVEADREPGHPSAWQLASAVFALLAAGLTALVIVGELLLFGLWWLFAGHADMQLLLGLTAVMLPYTLLICLAAQMTAVLHALGHFTWPALVPVVLNICWIASVWLVDPWFENEAAQAYALAVCVVLAGVLQLALQWPTLRRLGYRFDRRWEAVKPAVGKIVRAMVPVTFGLSITQINTFIDRSIALALTQPADGSAGWLTSIGVTYPLMPGAVSSLSYGERMYQFPLGVFGVALGTVLFPLLSRHAARGAFDLVRSDLSMGLRLVIAIGFPASVGLALVAEPLVRVVFQHGQFTAEDTRRVAGILVAYGVGVWAYCGIPVLFRGFYAVSERRIPMLLGLATVVVDQLLKPQPGLASGRTRFGAQHGDLGDHSGGAVGVVDSKASRPARLEEPRPDVRQGPAGDGRHGGGVPRRPPVDSRRNRRGRAGGYAAGPDRSGHCDLFRRRPLAGDGGVAAIAQAAEMTGL